MEITHNEKIYKGEKNRIIVALREDRATLQEIGDLFGCTRANISLILNKAGYYGYREYPELEGPKLFAEHSDEFIAMQLDVTLHKVAKARRDIGKQKENSITLGVRRKALCKYLIGKQYVPGANFVSWIYCLIEEHFQGPKYEAMHNFYVQGLTESTSEKINRDSRRVTRSQARQILKKEEFNVKQLLEEKVIEYNPKSRTDKS